MPPLKLSQVIVQQRDYSSVAIVESFFPRSFLLKSHPHTFACMGVVLSGRYRETLQGKSDDCRRGMIRYLPAGQPHSLQLDGSGRGMLFQVNQALLERVRDYTSFQPKAGTVAGNTFPLTQKLVAEFKLDDEATPLAIEALVLQILIQMSRGRALPAADVSPALLRARDLLHDHKGGRLELSKIAEQAGTHPVHLSRQFHRVFNRTMSGYLRDLMVQRARTFLADSDMPLSEIGQLCGFHDQSHFSRTFKNSTGLTPLEYRRQTRSQCRLCVVPHLHK